MVLAPASIPGVLDVSVFRSDAPRPGATEFVVEVPHGARGDAEFAAIAETLRSPLPAGLVDFFHVNTDAGAAELGEALALALTNSVAVSQVIVLRARVPRTFIDFNRVLDASRDAYRQGGVTPGIPPWITDAADHAALVAKYDAYQTAVKSTIDAVCGAGGRALLLHTYAPRTVDVEVNLDIVTALHAAYADPERWPLRPEVDVIFRRPDGSAALRPETVDGLRRALATIGLPLAEGVTYPMHPVTTAYHHAIAWPEVVVCMEVRRDLITDEFVPFREVVPSPERVDRIASALAQFVNVGWQAS